MKAIGLFMEAYKINQVTLACLKKVLPDNLKTKHFVILCFLYLSDKAVSPAALAKVFHLSRPVISSALHRLEDYDYIKLVSSPYDGRGKFVSISHSGRAIVENINDDFQDLFDNAYELSHLNIQKTPL